MSNTDTSPGDPIFYLHHSFIDRNWAAWQNADLDTRLYQIQGYTTQTEPSTGWVNTTLETPLSSWGVLPDVVVNDVMDLQGGYLCWEYDY